MAERYILNQGETLSIPVEAADRLLGLRSGDAALLYLYLLRHGECDARAAAALGLSASYADCMALLQKAGLVNAVPGDEAPPKPERPDELPEYTAEEITRRSDTDPVFQRLVNETSARLGKILTGADLKALFGIYDHLGLPSEVIVLLVSWCIRETKRRFGSGQFPTLRQIEKEAYIWANRELFTYERAEQYLKTRSARQTESAELAKLLGIYDRGLSPTEEKYLTAWLDMGFGRDAVMKAYDRTITKKGELAWPYMNRILENWHQKNLHTVPEIEAGDLPPRARQKQQPPSPAAADLQRMRDLMEQMNGGGKNGT